MPNCLHTSTIYIIMSNCYIQVLMHSIRLCHSACLEEARVIKNASQEVLLKHPSPTRCRWCIQSLRMFLRYLKSCKAQT